MIPVSELPPHLASRQPGYNLLTGKGIEIGAFHQPANLPPQCTVEYCDAQSREKAIEFFPELNVEQLVPVKHIFDLDKSGLSTFDADSYDFIVFNHVIEHIANPIRTIEELFRVAKSGGYVVISAPDKNYCSDIKREITNFEHLLEEYEQGVTEITDEHYIDFLKGVHPEVFDHPEDVQKLHIDRVRQRREHAHVWDSDAFHDFLEKTFALLKLSPQCVFFTRAVENQFEYFSVWKKP